MDENGIGKAVLSVPLPDVGSALEEVARAPDVLGAGGVALESTVGALPRRSVVHRLCWRNWTAATPSRSSTPRRRSGGRPVSPDRPRSVPPHQVRHPPPRWRCSPTGSSCSAHVASIDTAPGADWRELTTRNAERLLGWGTA
jgi:hypothetical protein